ncbi:MAG TPA: hypothetical protein VNJ05_09655 [Sphingomicrobium sp.]|nr:hypothetical protein [Sphingomicrobium sp.]
MIQMVGVGGWSLSDMALQLKEDACGHGSENPTCDVVVVGKRPPKRTGDLRDLIKRPWSGFQCVGSALWENKTGLLLDVLGWGLEIVPASRVAKALGGMAMSTTGMVVSAMEKDLSGAGFAYIEKQAAVGEGLGLAAAKRLGTWALVGSTAYDVKKTINDYNACRSGG